MKKYQPKFAGCPYLSTHGNLCCHKLTSKYCSHKQPKNCKYYNEWEKLIKMQEDAPDSL